MKAARYGVVDNTQSTVQGNPQENRAAMMESVPSVCFLVVSPAPPPQKKPPNLNAFLIFDPTTVKNEKILILSKVCHAGVSCLPRRNPIRARKLKVQFTKIWS